MSQTVFIIDDDDAMRDALLTLLRGEGIRCRAFPSGADFLENLPTESTACVITDVRMPGLDGAEIVRRLAELRGDAWPVVVITGHADVPLAVQLMKQGVVDFIEKPFDPSRLVETIRGCLGRLTVLDADQKVAALTQARLDRLTPREQQVFEALVEGKSNKAIALDLDISPRTVEVFRAKVMAKMEADSLSDLIRAGLSLARARPGAPRYALQPAGVPGVMGSLISPGARHVRRPCPPAAHPRLPRRPMDGGGLRRDAGGD